MVRRSLLLTWRILRSHDGRVHSYEVVGIGALQLPCLKKKLFSIHQHPIVTCTSRTRSFNMILSVSRKQVENRLRGDLHQPQIMPALGSTHVDLPICAAIIKCIVGCFWMRHTVQVLHHPSGRCFCSGRNARVVTLMRVDHWGWLARLDRDAVLVRRGTNQAFYCGAATRWDSRAACIPA